MFKKPAFEEILAYFQDSLDANQRLFIADRITHLKNRDIEDEISVMTHADIRSQNVLYDPQAKRLAIIDFETLKQRNIYHDFVPFAAASFKLPYDMLAEAIKKYNALGEKANIAVSSKKARLFHEMGIIHEYGRVAIFMEMADDRLKKQCSRMFGRIEELSAKWGNYFSTNAK